MVLGGARNAAACSGKVVKGSCDFRRSEECGCIFRR